MRYFYITLLILSINNSIQASLYTNLKKNVLSILSKAHTDNDKDAVPRSNQGLMRIFQHQRQEDANDKKSAQDKAVILKKVRTYEGDFNMGRDMPSSKLTESLDKKIGREYFHMDPVLNELRRRGPKKFRRQNTESDSYDDESSDIDEGLWMDEWREHWMQKKFEALNSTQPRGDVVNMVAARPWGVPCGDPNQHDAPWGTCMLPAECEAEYRIWRGDYFCGRTMFICCALLLTNYDMYQGLDVSFEGSSFSSNSDEKNEAKKDKADAKRKAKKEKKNRKKEREKRLKRIKKSIRRIVKEIRNILNKSFRNSTSERKKKTKELKKFIENMKKQNKKDRKAVVNIHEMEMIKMDKNLQSKLDQIKDVNEAFMRNDTFRDIIVNGTISKEKFRQLLRSNPKLKNFLKSKAKSLRSKPVKSRPKKSKPMKSRPMGTKTRRMNIQLDETKEEKKDSNGLEYDLEYGMLYY